MVTKKPKGLGRGLEALLGPKVAENGEAQEISTFAAGQFPLSVAFALDRSFSGLGATEGVDEILLDQRKSFLRPDGERAGLELGKELAENGFLKKPSTVVLVSGRQPGLVGATDTIRVRTLE